MSQHRSGIPLFGLPHKCDVVRRTATDDGAGGVTDSGTPVTLYTGRKCRITTLDPDDEELKGYGFNTLQNRKVLMVYSQSIQRDQEFLRIPWGTPPNVATLEGAFDGQPPQAVISTPGGNKTLTWDGSQWINDLSGYTLIWSTDHWEFTDAVAPDSLSLPVTLLETHNPFRFGDGWESINANYTVVSFGADPVDYKIVWHKHQIDNVGGTHHTSLVIELEDEDT